MKKRTSLYYKIFCKWCERDFSIDLNKGADLSISGHLMLNCHRCNNYAIFVKGDDVFEKFRDGYFNSKSKKLMKQKPQFSFFKKFEDD